MAGDITKKGELNFTDFDGRLDTTTFSNWLSAIEEYFDWYEISDERRV